MSQFTIEAQPIEVFVASHPIFDPHKNVYGYELEFRNDFFAHYDSMDPDLAKMDFMTAVSLDD